MRAPTAHSPAMKTLFVLTALVTFGAVVLGSIVCATDSSAACPNWPGCYVGQFTPNAELNPILEWVHRAFAISCAPLLLGSAIIGLSVRDKLVKVLPWVALIGAIIAGVLGMLTVLQGISKAAATFDLGASIVALIAITLAATCVLRAPRRWHLRSDGCLAWGAVATLFIYHLVSIAIAGSGSLTRCMSWPVWKLIEIDGNAAWQWGRLAIAGLSVFGAIATAIVALRQSSLRWLGALTLLLIAVELVMGFTVISQATTLPVKALYAAVAGAIFCAITWIASLTSIRSADAASPHAVKE